MPFHTVPCPSETFGPLWCEIDYNFRAPHLPGISIGDIVRLDEIAQPGEEQESVAEPRATGATLHRQVAWFQHAECSKAGAYTRVTLVPLDYPVMRQVELTNPMQGTSVCWVGSHEPLAEGSRIRLMGSLINWTVQRTFTALKVKDLPRDARIAFLSEVYA